MRKPRLAALTPILLLSALAGCAAEDPKEEGGSEPDASSSVCPSPLPEVFEGLRVTGEKGLLTATLIAASPLPPERFRNDWTVEIGDATAAAIGDVALTERADGDPAFRAWMVEHGHAGVPEATSGPSEGPGRFDLTFHLSMRGPWEIQIHAASPGAGTDLLKFHVCLPD